MTTFEELWKRDEMNSNRSPCAYQPNAWHAGLCRGGRRAEGGRGEGGKGGHQTFYHPVPPKGLYIGSHLFPLCASFESGKFLACLPCHTCTYFQNSLHFASVCIDCLHCSLCRSSPCIVCLHCSLYFASASLSVLVVLYNLN